MGQVHLADCIVLGECDESVMGAETESPVPGRNAWAEIPENAVLFSDENGEVSLRFESDDQSILATSQHLGCCI
jgi:hypothetical protein